VNRIFVATALAITLLLSACTQATPGPAPTTVATSAPTSSAGDDPFGFGQGNTSGIPTIEPIAEPTSGPVQTFTVQRGTVEEFKTLNGQIVPDRTTLSFVQDGVVTAIYVEPGQTVGKGTLVAELDTSDLETQLGQARITVEQNQRALNQAIAAGQLEVQQAEIELQSARDVLEQLKAPPSQLEIAQAQTNIRLAEANLSKVRNDASQAKNTAKEQLDGAVLDLQAIQANYGTAYNQLQAAIGTERESELRAEVAALEAEMRAAEVAIAQAMIDYDTARNNEIAAVQQAEAQLSLARAQLDDLLSGPDSYDIAAQERLVQRAETVVAQARQRAQGDPALRSAIQTSQLQVENIEDQIQSRRLYAPTQAEVAEVEVSIGTPISAGNPIITLVDRSRQNLIAQESAANTGNVSVSSSPSVGQPVTVVFDRYPGQTFNGSLGRVPAPPDEFGFSDPTYEVNFDAEGQPLVIGDTATINILLVRRPDTLWLPLEAVNLGRDGGTVTVERDGERRVVEILIGIVATKR
jgi:HlyD family secretion protein